MRALFTALFLIAAPAGAECVGQNVFDTMPPAKRASIEAAAQAAPYAEGNFWRAEKDGAVVTLVGTFHLDDPRHEATMARIGPWIDAATIVLVEAGPTEEAALKTHLARDPYLMVLKDTTLPELLPPDDWTALSSALKRRGIPPVIAAKFQPWFVSMLLAMPSCEAASPEQTNGLDARVIERATSSLVPVRALEPYDTAIRIFERLTLEEQFAMVRSSLAMEDRAEDYAVTLSDAYFAGHSRLIWELSRAEARDVPGYDLAQIDADFAKMEEELMAIRNRAWIPVIDGAAKAGPVFAAFGALHLSGRDGVLALLEQDGWAILPLSVAP